MYKNYSDWSVLKTEINNNQPKLKEFKIGEIWWCHVGLNIGSEEDGKNNNYERPILVAKKFNSNMFLGIPCSTKIRDKKHYYIVNNLDKIFNLNFSQIRVLSSRRLIRIMAFLGDKNVERIIKSLRDYI